MDKNKYFAEQMNNEQWPQPSNYTDEKKSGIGYDLQNVLDLI